MIEIPAGDFMMGDAAGQWDEIPVHNVKISNSFFISQTEVTAKQFGEFKKDYRFAGENYAIGVDWYEAAKFCKWLSEKEGENYRLPTEAEWEYVCRNREKFGVENMLDSIHEWCSDWYGEYVDLALTDPVGVGSGLTKVVRGGLPDIFIKEYTYPEKFYYRAANRSGIAPTFDGFTLPALTQIQKTATQDSGRRLPKLAGIIYDDLNFKNVLALYPLPFVNSSALKWIDHNDWAAKWVGSIIAPISGEVVFRIDSDNETRIELDGKIILNSERQSARVSLQKNKIYPIKIYYTHNGGLSRLKLYWSWKNQDETIIPRMAFSHSFEEGKAVKTEYLKSLFSRYVKPSIGFRIVQAPAIKSEPTQNELPFVRQCIKQEIPKPNKIRSKPYFRKRFLHPVPPDNSDKEEIKLSGLHPSLGGHNHHSALVVCPNGDLLAVYFSASFEDDPEVLLMGSRLRYGADEWDMPTPIIDFPDVNDVSPLLWRDGNKIYLFWGNIHLKGGFPFQWVESTDNGATFSEVKFPIITNVSDGYAPQPISSVFKDKNGTVYLACDGVGAHSFLWASKDGMKTWFDTDGRTGGRHTALVPLKDGSFFGVGGKKSDIDGFMPISISKDKGRTWQIKKSIFPSLGGGQRPALIRLKSGALLYAGDFQRKDGFQPAGINERGAFVALSFDEGETWKIKKLPGTLKSSKEETAKEMKGRTIGYVSLAQSDNGMIHLITSKNSPALHFEFNEMWILNRTKKISEADIMKSTAHKITVKKDYNGKYPDGNIRVKYKGGIADNGKFLLDGKEEWFYEDGSKKYEAEFKLGKKIGTEKYLLHSGKILWEINYEKPDEFTWLQYWRNGKIKSESHWVDFHCNGIAKHFDNKGTLVKELAFVNGRIIK